MHLKSQRYNCTVDEVTYRMTFLIPWQFFKWKHSSQYSVKTLHSPVIKVNFVCTFPYWNTDVNFYFTLVLQGMKQFNRLSNLSLKFNAVLKVVGCINC